MLLGGVFKATGNASPVTVPAKGRWMNDDMPRWAKRWGVPFTMNPHFPINTLTLMRGACGLLMRQPEEFKRYVDAVFHAMWVAPRNLNDTGELAAVLGAAGFDAAAFSACLLGNMGLCGRVRAATHQATHQSTALKALIIIARIPSPARSGMPSSLPTNREPSGVGRKRPSYSEMIFVRKAPAALTSISPSGARIRLPMVFPSN
jgi:hypothetical protein